MMDVVYFVKINGYFTKASGGNYKTYKTYEQALRFNRRRAELGANVEIVEYRLSNITEVGL